jgi:mannose-6-phosphate isomerase-like protein (cupin superfamily)
MALTIHPLSAIAARIDQPFSLISLGLVGDVGVHLYVAQGQLDWHKHIDEDELFLVHDGAIDLDTELGSTVLYNEEAMLVPKGIGHQSKSALRSVVILFRQQVLPERKNGHRNYIVTGDEAPLAKARLGNIIPKLSVAFEPQKVAMLEDYRLSVMLARDFGPADTARPGGALLYTMRGSASIELDSGGARLEPGQLTILPSGTPYKIHCAKPAILVKFERE